MVSLCDGTGRCNETVRDKVFCRTPCRVLPHGGCRCNDGKGVAAAERFDGTVAFFAVATGAGDMGVIGDMGDVGAVGAPVEDDIDRKRGLLCGYKCENGSWLVVAKLMTMVTNVVLRQRRS
jgi:hypothetical protein